MAVFRVERNTGYTVMSNHHLRNKELSLKAKGLLSQMLSLPEDWDYTLAGLSHINREKIDAIREAVKELEKAGYIVRSRERDEKGRFESTAKKYNIDFSLKKVKGEQTRYLVFFKGRDADVMTAAFQEFSAKKLNREKKPSIRKALAAAKDKAKQLNAARDKVKKMDRGREI